MIVFRLGFTKSDMSPDEEVNEFLKRAIDARDVEQLKEQNVRPLMLKFLKPEFETKVRNFYLLRFKHSSNKTITNKFSLKNNNIKKHQNKIEG